MGWKTSALPESLQPKHVLETWRSAEYPPIALWPAKLRVLYPEAITSKKLVASFEAALVDGGLCQNHAEVTTAMAALMQGGPTGRLALERLALIALSGKTYSQVVFEPAPIPEPLTIEGDAMVANDAQLPALDNLMNDRMLAVARKYKIKQLIFNGDFWDFGAISRFPASVPLPTIANEMEASALLINMWLKQFDRVLITLGNHDMRLLGIFNGKMTIDNILSMVTHSDRVQISILDHSFLISGGVKWAITHGANYSRSQLFNPARYAVLFHSNVIVGHEHHHAIGHDDSGQFVVIANGGLFDVKKMHYVQLVTKTNPRMVGGFTMVKNGRATLFGDEAFTDYEMLGIKVDKP